VPFNTDVTNALTQPFAKAIADLLSKQHRFAGARFLLTGVKTQIFKNRDEGSFCLRDKTGLNKSPTSSSRASVATILK